MTALMATRVEQAISRRFSVLFELVDDCIEFGPPKRSAVERIAVIVDIERVQSESVPELVGCLSPRTHVVVVGEEFVEPLDNEHP